MTAISTRMEFSAGEQVDDGLGVGAGAVTFKRDRDRDRYVVEVDVFREDAVWTYRIEGSKGLLTRRPAERLERLLAQDLKRAYDRHAARLEEAQGL